MINNSAGGGGQKLHNKQYINLYASSLLKVYSYLQVHKGFESFSRERDWRAYLWSTAPPGGGDGGGGGGSLVIGVGWNFSNML